MSSSAFAGLKLSTPTAGREQRLFTATPPAEPTPDTAGAPAPASTLTRGRATSLAPAPAPSNGRVHERPHNGTLERALERTNAAPDAPTPSAESRLIRRHSYDIRIDQVRWMSRLKLELEERYGTRITANALVQAAIDLLRADCERSWEASVVYRTLVLGAGSTTTAREGGDS